MSSRTHLGAATGALLLAIACSGLAWHFGWRVAAHWSTGEQIGAEELQRAQAMSNLFALLVAASFLAALVFTGCLFKSRRGSESSLSDEAPSKKV
jgi:hypothetical protein